MWQHISFTVSAALDTYNRIHKNWVKFGTSYATTFLVLGFIIGFGVLTCLGFLLQPEWADFGNADEYFYLWFNHALQLDYRILIMSTGLLGAWLQKHPESGQQPFHAFSRSIPRAAWQLFILLAVVQAMVYYIQLSGTMSEYTYSYTGDAAADNRRKYLSWLNDIIEIAGTLLPYPMAGFLYLKAAGLTKVPLYKKELFSLLVVGYAFNALIGTVSLLLARIIITPMSVLLNKSWMVMALSQGISVFLGIATVMGFGYIVHSAFREEEVHLDIENS